jgi:beta-galactosidase
MEHRRRSFFVTLVCTLGAASAAVCQNPDAVLPPGVRAVWDLGKAYREATPTRERLCINGLWRWQPAEPAAEQVPPGSWGYFKVPGSWPGPTDYLRKDSQTLYRHPDWGEAGEPAAAWYQREITIPSEWAGRRITVTAETLNSFAAVYVDGHKAGDMRFPAGEVDLTGVCRPGTKQVLSMLVVAMPLRAVMMSFGDTSAARQVRGSVERKGLCGDVYLVGTPPGARLGEVRVATSVRRWEITVNAGLENLAADSRYALHARISDHGRQVAAFTSPPLTAADLKAGRAEFTAKWKPGKLWDIITPGNQYQATVSLLEARGRTLDVSPPQRFGFRELWIRGRDFYLNGSRIFLCAIPIDNAAVSAAASTYEAAKETLRRMKGFGINFVYTHNYGCEPGTHLSFTEILRAADDVGMLVALSQPHFGQYGWQAPDADQKNGYARDAACYVSVAGSHPSVVFYATSHNATGYVESMNPDMIDGLQAPVEPWGRETISRALRAQAILNGLDPTRIVYHHSSGNLGTMHTNNFYTNMAPSQELADWFEHWSKDGVKPLFTCEFSCPYTWDFTMYRGWYKGKREWGSAVVPWEYSLAEWNAQFLGDRAFQIGEVEKGNLRWEAQKNRTGAPFHRWDYPHAVGTRDIDAQYPVMARYLTDEWRAFRTLGVSAINPWEHEVFWKPRPGVDRSPKQLKVDWGNLQRPGFSADFIGPSYERMDMAFERADWLPTPAAQALLRNNMPLLAYLGGKAAAVTGKDHNFTPGETVEKQLILINNSRRTVTADCRWSLGLPRALTGSRRVTIATGNQVRLPLRLGLPANLPANSYRLTATVRFSTGETQADAFTINVLPRPAAPTVSARIAVFDPKGEATKLLAGMGIRGQAVAANADLAGYDLLVVGKGALTPEGPGPDIARVREGLRVVVFEQTAEVLEQRFGFRVAEYGLRQAFARVPDHPLLAGLQAAHLRDWRGAATISTPRLKYEKSQVYRSVTPTIKWCGLDVPQIWRCGNRGNVASALIEKPAKGDFLPVIEGGYSLQYAPLMAYREGKGLVLFCQMDVTGRTERDPAAEMLARNVLRYASAWQPAATRQALYVGPPAGRRHLEFSGVAVASYDGGQLSPDQVLIVGSGAGGVLAANATAIADFVRAGGHVLALGLDEPDANAFLGAKVTMRKAEHIAAYFEPFGVKSLLAGVGPADVHNRAPREVPLVSAGAAVAGDGVLAQTPGANVVFYQLPPYAVGWADGVAVPVVTDNAAGKQQVVLDPGLRRTYRRSAFALARLLANMGVAAPTPLLARFSSPVTAAGAEQRWLDAFYLDHPEEWDYPYRFFCW